MTRLLIVEEDQVLARALAEQLSRLQPTLRVLVARGPVEARELLGEQRVDLVLSELSLAETNGFELVGWVASRCPGTSLFTMCEPGREPSAAALSSLGIVACFTKPLDTQAALQRFADALSESIYGQLQNVSLISFLQLLEMERKTCHLTVTSGEKRAELVVRAGQLVHARCDGAEGETAAISVVAWPAPGIAIGRSHDITPPSIERTLGFIVMEAMRLQDEAAQATAHGADARESNWPPERRTWRPTGAPNRRSQPPTGIDQLRRLNGDFSLSSGAHLLAVVDTITGAVLQYAAAAGSPVSELARHASQVLQQEISTLRLCNAEGLEELVLSTTTRCDVIRPLGGNEFALLVFAPEETNLMMARFELEQFIASASDGRGERS